MITPSNMAFTPKKINYLQQEEERRLENQRFALQTLHEYKNASCCSLNLVGSVIHLLASSLAVFAGARALGCLYICLAFLLPFVKFLPSSPLHAFLLAAATKGLPGVKIFRTIRACLLRLSVLLLLLQVMFYLAAHLIFFISLLSSAPIQLTRQCLHLWWIEYCY